MLYSHSKVAAFKSGLKLNCKIFERRLGRADFLVATWLNFLDRNNVLQGITGQFSIFNFLRVTLIVEQVFLEGTLDIIDQVALGIGWFPNSLAALDLSKFLNIERKLLR